MEHIKYTILDYRRFAQKALSKGDKSYCSDLINLIVAYNDAYADTIYERVKYYIQSID